MNMNQAVVAPQVVSRALRRDAGIITQPANKVGYSVHRGNRPSIWVNVSDAEPTNVRQAARLVEHLVELGWRVERHEESSIIYVYYVPTKDEAAAAERLAAAEAAEIDSQARMRAAAQQYRTAMQMEGRAARDAAVQRAAAEMAAAIEAGVAQ